MSEVMKAVQNAVYGGAHMDLLLSSAYLARGLGVERD